MRTLRLAQVAAHAEGLRLRRHARRVIIRTVVLCGAGFYFVLAVGFVHIAAWRWLGLHFGPVQTALIIAAADAVIGLVLVGFAARSTPDRIELEAQLVREQACQGMRRSLDFWALLVPVAQLFATFSRRGRARD